MADDPSTGLSDLDCRCIRILAMSTNGTPEKDRVSERLNRAAEVGSVSDMEEAMVLFGELTVEERREIEDKSITQATNSAAMRRILFGGDDPVGEDSPSKAKETLDPEWQPLRR